MAYLGHFFKILCIVHPQVIRVRSYLLSLQIFHPAYILADFAKTSHSIPIPSPGHLRSPFCQVRFIHRYLAPVLSHSFLHSYLTFCQTWFSLYILILYNSHLHLSSQSRFLSLHSHDHLQIHTSIPITQSVPPSTSPNPYLHPHRHRHLLSPHHLSITIPHFDSHISHSHPPNSHP